jgi:TraM recognition site of TraD and TraG
MSSVGSALCSKPCSRPSSTTPSSSPRVPGPFSILHCSWFWTRQRTSLPLRDLDTLASTAAGHGIQLVSVFQDLSQISNRYGERAQTVVNNHRAKIVLSGISETRTLEYASRLLSDAARTFVAVPEHLRIWHGQTRPIGGGWERTPRGIGVGVLDELLRVWNQGCI